jgi:uncharacterized membrane protein
MGIFIFSKKDTVINKMSLELMSILSIGIGLTTLIVPDLIMDIGVGKDSFNMSAI